MDADYALLQDHLNSSERVLWWGRPDPRVLFTPRDVFLVPFSLMWGGFAIFWEVMVLSARPAPPFFFPIFGAFFCAMGVYIIIGRFFVKRFLNSRTLYALTDARALVVKRSGASVEIPLRGERIEITRSSASTHMGLAVGSANASGWQSARGSNQEMYLNTGMDPLFVRADGVVRFFDVADTVGLTAAIKQVRELQAK